MIWMRRAGLLLAALLVPLVSGCNPLAMGFGTPVPMQPWVAESIENKYMHQNDFRTPIMPPIREGFPPPICEDAPTEREVLRAMPRVARGVPYIYEDFRDDIKIVCERLVDKIDPPRFFPLVGPAQLHHCHWKCTIYYTETQQSDYPFPAKVKRRRVQVMYIDKDHLHQYVPDPEAARKITNEHTGY
jgi:hypothetical protein